MSRETDTPSTGPDGRGGAAYPSGTPPYGIPAIPDEGTDAGRSAARPEERKTETTLTTRIRINIPGSRPIPPVVVRQPVKDKDNQGADDRSTANGPGTDGGTPAPGPDASAGPAEAPAAPGAPAPLPTRPTGGRPSTPKTEEKPTSDWFAPRKSPAAKGGTGSGPANGSAPAAGSGTAGGGSGAGGGTANGVPGPGARAGAGRPGGVVGGMNAPGGSRPQGTNGSAPGTGSTNGAGLPGATGGPVAPGHGGGTGSFDVTEALAGGTRPGQGGAGEPGRDDLPYFPEGGPAGPTTGPVTGSGRPMGGPGGADAPGRPGGGPAGPGAPGAPGQGGVPGGGLSDDTAILTPQIQVPEPGPGYGARHDNVSGNTVTSGIPVVPASAAFDADTPAGGPRAHTPPKLPEPGPAPAASSSKPSKKKGRSKLVLLCGGLVFLGGVAYGAGLLMNHSDVPKGTSVLGVDIGGGTRDDAVQKLDAALGDRLNEPLKLTVGGKTVELEPDNAGLQFDADATVADAAQSDYNPVSVIGSLFGNQRAVDPVMPVDEEKLHAALNDVGGTASNTDGTIKFVSGKAVAVYGKPGEGIDVDKSTEVVAAAYRTQVETGASSPVTVPTTTRQPTVSKAEVDRMMKEFAEPAMSANVTVQTDAAHSIPMSPENSLWKFLRVEAVNGKLVDKPDLGALKKLYGQTFDGVLITRGNGEKTPVTPQDVYGALREALMSKTDRVAVIETDPS
ncbi:hypothetical protein [Streptomyces sp. enrichment culture]|uniref:hypothetical protein n=1 Tax=Streptomyces sp. enrichment culture TaxID=1795815 RepID=UPI003F54B0CC